MTEQAEQTTNESKPLAEWSSDEVQAELKRLDQELAQSPPASLRASSESGSSAREPRTPFTDARTGEDLIHEINATRRNLLREYEGLEQDSRFNDEHRTEQAWKAYDKAKPRIEQRAAAARETLLKDAERLEEASIPFPGGQSLRTDSAQLLSLTQGERARLIDALNYEHPSIARLKAQGKKAPAEDRPEDILRDSYGRALKRGGVQGAAICRAALQIAEERGIGVDEIVDEFRHDWQRYHLQNAQQARIQAQSVYSKTPLPSAPRPGGPRTIEELGAGKKRSALGLTRKSGPAIPKKPRRRSWK